MTYRATQNDAKTPTEAERAIYHVCISFAKQSSHASPKGEISTAEAAKEEAECDDGGKAVSAGADEAPQNECSGGRNGRGRYDEDIDVDFVAEFAETEVAEDHGEVADCEDCGAGVGGVAEGGDEGGKIDEREEPGDCLQEVDCGEDVEDGALVVSFLW